MKNAKIIVIHGAPGSGKSTTAALLHEKLRSPWFEFGWIPEFRNLNPHTEISFEQETEISFENLILVVKNYIRHGFEYIIVTDINFDSQILRLPEVFDGIEYRLFTLFVDDETRKKRILSRDNGNTFRDFESAAKINSLLVSRPLLPNETRICTENMSAAEVADKIIEELSTMDKITIKQAQESDIAVLESIFMDTVNWLDEMGQPLWGASEISWDALSKSYKIGDFYIAYLDGKPCGCMAIVDYDPFFWPDVKQGDSLFVHKLAVAKSARKSGAADALMDFFKMQGVKRGAKTLRLDTHALRPRLRAFYERHGFVFVETKILNGDRHTAFYLHALPHNRA